MKLILGGLLVALLVSLSGCSPETASSPAEPPTPVAKVLWTRALRPIGQPALAGGVAVTLVKAGKRSLDVVGVDVGTGKLLWRHPAYPGDAPTGMSIRPAVGTAHNGKQYVVVQSRPRPGLDSWAPLQALDPTTGKVVHTTPSSEHLTSPLGSCSNGKDICAESPLGDLRFDLDRWSVSFDMTSTPRGARFLAEGLYSTADRPGERLGAVDGSRRLWERGVGSLLPPGFGSDAGWNVSRGSGVYVGNLGYTFPAHLVRRYESGEPVTTDIATPRVMISIEAKSGRVWWTKPGADRRCLPDGFDGVDVRCTYRGRAVYRKGVDGSRLVGAHLGIEGLEPTTGEPTWSVTLTASGARQMWKEELPHVGDDHLVVETAEGLRLLDLRSGELTELASDDVLLCREDATFTYGIYQRNGGELIYACTPTGKESSTAPGAAAIERAALKAPGGVYLTATNEGLVAYRIESASPFRDPEYNRADVRNRS